MLEASHALAILAAAFLIGSQYMWSSSETSERSLKHYRTTHEFDGPIQVVCNVTCVESSSTARCPTCWFGFLVSFFFGNIITSCACLSYLCLVRRPSFVSDSVSNKGTGKAVVRSSLALKP